MSAVTFPDDIVVPGDLRLTGDITPLKSRSSVLAITELEKFPVPLTLWRVHDAMQTNLPASSGDDDLSLVGGTFGTNHPSLQTEDFGGGSTTQYARAHIALPGNYVAGNTIKLRFSAGMLTTEADNSCTLDVVCYTVSYTHLRAHET